MRILSSLPLLPLAALVIINSQAVLSAASLIPTTTEWNTAASIAVRTTTATSAFYQRQANLISIEDTRVQHVMLQAKGKSTWNVDNCTDVTSCFVDSEDEPAFIDTAGVARATVSGDEKTDHQARRLED